MKRGSIIDLAFIMVISLVVGITFLIVSQLISDMDEDSFFQNSPVWDRVENSANLLDTLYPLIMFSFFIGSVILAFMVRSTPLAFGAGILALLMLVFIAPTISNVWEEVSGNDQWTVSTTSVDSFFGDLPTFILIFGSLILVAMQVGGFSRGSE